MALFLFMGKAKKAVATTITIKNRNPKPMTVRVDPGQTAIVRTHVTHDVLPKTYFFKWVEQCKKIPEDHWQPRVRHLKVCEKGQQIVDSKGFLDKIMGCTCRKEVPIPIATMHNMQLINSMKWAVDMATKAIASSRYAYFNVTKAQLLATLPQWKHMLIEAQKRDLYIVQNAPEWWRACKEAVTWHELGV
jgi:hypothetical protein